MRSRTKARLNVFIFTFQFGRFLPTTRVFGGVFVRGDFNALVLG